MSNFICEKCGMTNIDCGHQGYKTEREIELEKQLDREIKINRKMKSALEKYADSGYWFSDGGDEENIFMCGGNGYELAKQILKEIGEEK